MGLDEFFEGFEEEESSRRRRLAADRSYEITEYLPDIETRLDTALQGETLVGSTAPSIFIGHDEYPTVSAGVLSPVGGSWSATEYLPGTEWYEDRLEIEDIVARRAGLLNSHRRERVSVHDTWDGFVGASREIAIADTPVDVEVELTDRPELSLDVDAMTTPQGPQATASTVRLTENPSVPRPIKKTLEDDDWQAEGAMRYLYRRGYDVQTINTILSAGALGKSSQRRLVPTRWSITAVDDTIGQYLRGQIDRADPLAHAEVHSAEYLGNHFWVCLLPGQWEFELVEVKAPGSVWNPEQTAYQVASDYEGHSGRTGYVEETAGAYYAARLGVLEQLSERDRQAKALVVRTVTDGYWAPVGVWQIREAIRGAFEGETATTTPTEALTGILQRVPVEESRLRRASTLIRGRQSTLSDRSNWRDR